MINLSLEAGVVLLGILWSRAHDRKARVRAALFSPLLLSAALASYAWYFQPLPPALTGVADTNGYCLQTSRDSCSAAAAVTLLAVHGIRTTEARMAALCLTRASLGTPHLGLYRGLSVAAASCSLRPRVIHFADLSDLRKGPYPCLISVGLKNGCPPAIRERLISMGWEQGLHHTVVVLGADAKEPWVSVFDPTNGHERWPLADLDSLWDNYALILTPR